ncbi:MAG: type II secretion system protein N [Desulfobacteria bacterium]
MRKPVYLAVMGISIVVAAGSLGVTLTRYLGLLAYSPKGTAQAAATATVPNVPPTPPEKWNNLFAPRDGMKMASRLPASSTKTASQAPRSNFLLVGTIVSSTPSGSRAVLWASSMKEPKAFREKEEVEPGAFLSSVERDKVWITRGNEREKLEILPVGSRARSTATAARPVPPPVAAAAPHRAVPAGPSALPLVVPASRPSSGRSKTVGVPDTFSGNEEEDHLTPRQRRRRAPGLRR